MATTFPEGTKRGLVDYPFQLRPDLWVTLRLPADLTRTDVDRISEWLDILASAQRSSHE